MTPPVRHNWDEPDAYFLRDAMKLALEQAARMDAEMTIAAYVQQYQLVFNVMLSSAYKELTSSRGYLQENRLAAVVTVQPDGTMKLLGDLTTTTQAT